MATVTFTSGGSVSATSFIATSSRNAKDNIYSANDVNATDMINDIDIVHYNYIVDPNKEPMIGFIAEDTDSIFSTTQQKAMNVNNCIGMLLKAVQELSAKVQELESKLESK